MSARCNQQLACLILAPGWEAAAVMDTVRVGRYAVLWDAYPFATVSRRPHLSLAEAQRKRVDCVHCVLPRIVASFATRIETLASRVEVR